MSEPYWKGIDAIRAFVNENIKYGDWEFVVKNKGETIYVQVQFMAPDNFKPGKSLERQYCRKWQLSVWMTPTEIVQTCWAAIQRAVLHEAAETFKYKGADIFNTHISVDKLAEIRKSKGAVEHRGEPVMSSAMAAVLKTEIVQQQMQGAPEL